MEDAETFFQRVMTTEQRIQTYWWHRHLERPVLRWQKLAASIRTARRARIG